MLKPDALAGLMVSDTPHAVLDVRERGAFERGHVFRTTTLPRRQLEFRVPGLVTAPATPIALIDADGALAPLAATTLGAMGYRDVRVLDGGLAAWRAAGRRVVQGLNVPSKVFGERALHEWGTPQIAPHELMRRIDKRDDLVIVDSRTFEEYHRGCIPGSISVPGGELVLRIGELVERPETTIVVHCGGRTRSYIGAESLRRMRLPNPIVALENGTMGWELAGLTLERGANRTAPAPGSKSHVQAAATAKRVAAEDGVRSLGVDDVRRLWDARRAAARTRKPGDLGAALVVDVGMSDAYARGHVPGAGWICRSRLESKIPGVGPDRTRPIVLTCEDGVASTLAAATLAGLGYKEVSVLEGGTRAWTDAGRPLEEGTTRVWDEADGVADRTTPLPHMLPTADAFAEAVGALGVGAGDRVVVYDTRGVVSAARVWWTFRAFGHDAVAVLDGGFPKWKAEGRPIESGEAKAVRRVFRATLRPALVRDLAAMRDNLTTRREQVLDARSAGRFAATEPEPRAGLRGGHIPGSLNLPSDTLVRPDGTLLPAGELRKKFEAAGVDFARPVATTCGSGITASVLAFALHVLGHPRVAVYDGSSTELGGRTDTPVKP